jgi:hypothetical protein
MQCKNESAVGLYFPRGHASACLVSEAASLSWMPASPPDANTSYSEGSDQRISPSHEVDTGAPDVLTPVDLGGLLSLPLLALHDLGSLILMLLCLLLRHVVRGRLSSVSCSLSLNTVLWRLRGVGVDLCVNTSVCLQALSQRGSRSASAFSRKRTQWRSLRFVASQYALLVWTLAAVLSCCGASSIGAGWYHTCALTAAGGVRCWGQNNYGQASELTTMRIWLCFCGTHKRVLPRVARLRPCKQRVAPARIADAARAQLLNAVERAPWSQIKIVFAHWVNICLRCGSVSAADGFASAWGLSSCLVPYSC